MRNKTLEDFDYNFEEEKNTIPQNIEQKSNYTVVILSKVTKKRGMMTEELRSTQQVSSSSHDVHPL